MDRDSRRPPPYWRRDGHSGYSGQPDAPFDPQQHRPHHPPPPPPSQYHQQPYHHHHYNPPHPYAPQRQQHPHYHPPHPDVVFHGQPPRHSHDQVNEDTGPPPRTVEGVPRPPLPPLLPDRRRRRDHYGPQHRQQRGRDYRGGGRQYRGSGDGFDRRRRRRRSRGRGRRQRQRRTDSATGGGGSDGSLHITPYHRFSGGGSAGVNPSLPEAHLQQNPDYPDCERVLEPFDRPHRILAADAPKKKYYSRKKKGELISVNHWGQRKLLLSEIEFLTMYATPEHVVVYAGAAPGTHTNFLASLFPDVRFVLVDPAEFSCRETPQIEIRKEYFTDEMAASFAGQKTLFLSDIRTANHRIMSFEEVEEHVEKDMRWQETWTKLMKADKAMLKFRLPYFDEKRHQESSTFAYLAGEIFLPVWGRQSTTECRLICDGDAPTKEYSIKGYEDQMFYFNTTTRVLYYPHLVEYDGLDHCFDCRSEVYILQNYLKKIRKVSPIELIPETQNLIQIISRECSPHSGRTLRFIEPTQASFLTNSEREFEKQKTSRLLGMKPLAEEDEDLDGDDDAEDHESSEREEASLVPETKSLSKKRPRPENDDEDGSAPPKKRQKLQ